MTEATIQRCSDDHCVNGFQRVHATAKPTRPGYCSWCWNQIPSGSLPIYRVRGVMLHDTKDPDYTYVDEIFESVDRAQGWIEGEFSDAFVDACTVDTEVDPTLEGYMFDDFEIVRVASPEFPIQVLEVM